MDEIDWRKIFGQKGVGRKWIGRKVDLPNRSKRINKTVGHSKRSSVIWLQGVWNGSIDGLKIVHVLCIYVIVHGFETTDRIKDVDIVSEN